MKVSREQFAANRQRILEEASRLFRARGFDSVKLTDVMQAAGMTHGAFYGHFDSKEDLVAQTLAHRASRPRPEVDLAQYVENYLSVRHWGDPANGCDIAGMGPDTLHESAPARSAMTAMIRAQVDRLALSSPGEDAAARRRTAVASWSAMFGAMVLARLSDDDGLSNELLAETRATLIGFAKAPDAE